MLPPRTGSITVADFKFPTDPKPVAPCDECGATTVQVAVMPSMQFDDKFARAFQCTACKKIFWIEE